MQYSFVADEAQNSLSMISLTKLVIFFKTICFHCCFLALVIICPFVNALSHEDVFTDGTNGR
jgi:hypothetical protein